MKMEENNGISSFTSANTVCLKPITNMYSLTQKRKEYSVSIAY